MAANFTQRITEALTQLAGLADWELEEIYYRDLDKFGAVNADVAAELARREATSNVLGLQVMNLYG